MYNSLSFSLGKGEFPTVIQNNIALQVFDKKSMVVGDSCGPAEEQQGHWRYFASGSLEAAAVDSTDRPPLGRKDNHRDRLVAHRSWVFCHIFGVLAEMVCTNHSYQQQKLQQGTHHSSNGVYNSKDKSLECVFAGEDLVLLPVATQSAKMIFFFFLILLFV